MSAKLIAAGAPAGSGRLILGIAVAICSAVLYDVGYILEKQALSALPTVAAHPLSLFRTVRASPRWLAGFASMIAGLGLQVVALTLAPVSVVQPVLAAGLVVLVIAGGPVLGERLRWRQKAALLLVIGAVVAIAVSSRPGARLAGTVPAARFAAVVVPVAVVALAAAWAGIRVDRRVGPTATRAAWTVGLLAGAAGLLYGLGAVAEKAIAAELVGRGFYHGILAALSSSYPWLFVVVTMAGMVVFQVTLQRHPASFVATVSNVVSSVCALTGASVVFGELLLPPGWWSVARVAGFAGVAAALTVLATSRDVEAAIP